MLMWSAVVNGRPPVFADTALYYSEAEYLVEAVGLIGPTEHRAPRGDPTALPSRPGAPNVSATIDGARSPIYGLFVYGLERLGSLWLVAGVQALAVALTLNVLFRAAAPRAPAGAYLAWIALLAGTTSLPFFSSFIMPDVFTGVAGGACLTVLVYWDRLSRSDRLAVTVLLVFSLCVHRSNLLVIAGLGAAGAALLQRTGFGARQVGIRAGLICGAALAAVALGQLTALPIADRAGEPIGDPPFLMARMLADGPGRLYLRHVCARGDIFAACRFSRLPPEDSDTLLWSGRRARGMFGAADYPTRLRLESEQTAFVLGALAYAPVEQFRASLSNVAVQLASNHVKSPLADQARYVTDGYWRRTSLEQIIPGAASCRNFGPCGSRISPELLDRWHDLVLTASLLAAASVALWLAATPGQAPDDDLLGKDRARCLRLLVLMAVLLVWNAAVCGALSAPVARYQARLIWLLPAVASLVTIITRPWLTLSFRDLLAEVASRIPFVRHRLRQLDAQGAPL